MDYSRHKNLAEMLISKTASNQLVWEPSIKDNTFQVSIRKNTVRISKFDDENPIVLSIFNQDGDLVEAFDAEELRRDGERIVFEGGTWYEALRDLYLQARRTALQSDKIMDEILEGLNETQS
jgi:hypothetical protein